MSRIKCFLPGMLYLGLLTAFRTFTTIWFGILSQTDQYVTASMHSLLWLSTQPQSYDDAWWCHLFTFLLHITGYQCLHLYGCTSSSETILLFPVFPEPVLWCIVTYWRLWKCCSQTCVSLSLCFAHKCGAFLCH